MRDIDINRIVVYVNRYFQKRIFKTFMHSEISTSAFKFYKNSVRNYSFDRIFNAGYKYGF